MRALLFLLLLLPLLLAAQGHREYADLGERYAEASDFEKAAENYALAYAARPRQVDYAGLAAQYFYTTKNYPQAIAHYEHLLKGKPKLTFQFAGLKLARLYKMTEQFTEAKRAYLTFLNSYDLDDKEVINQIVHMELAGIAYVEKLIKEDKRPEFVAQRIKGKLNTAHNELAPMPLAGSVLYFISDRQADIGKMFRSDLQPNEVYSGGYLAEQFPVVADKHIGAGALGPGNDRFYFTLCSSKSYLAQPVADCQIYVTVRRDDTWSKPQALPEYINRPGHTAMHPYLYQEGDKEIMIYAATGADSKGGLDLYSSERFLNSNATDFSFPKNLGTPINSIGDEIAPFYRPETNTLYFSSNGYMGLGGFDVFIAINEADAWHEPNNLSRPINSSADDYYYRISPEGNTAFLASNRREEADSTSRWDENIYRVRRGAPDLKVNVQVLGKDASKPLKDVALIVNEIKPDSSRRLLVSTISDDGFFSLELPTDITVELEVQHLDYERTLRRYSVPQRARRGFQFAPITLEPRPPLVTSSEPTRPATRPTRPVRKPIAQPARPTTQPVTAPNVADSSSPTTNSSSATRPTTQPSKPTSQSNPTRTSTPPTKSSYESGVKSYRIQIEARSEFNEYHGRYDGVRNLGPLSQSPVPGKALVRVFVGSYFSKKEAQEALQNVRELSWRDAYIVRFRGDSYDKPVY